MSTPTSERAGPGRGRPRGRRRPALLALPVLLAACATSIPASDRAELRVAGSRVTVVAPEGFCVDPESVDVTRAGGFVLFGDCAVLNGEAAGGGAPVSAVVSASVANDGVPGSLAALGDFLAEGPGLVTLGRSGDAEAVRVLSRDERDGVLYLKVEDTGPTPIPGSAAVLWRGFFEAGDRLVFGTVNAFAPAALSDAEAEALLAGLARRTRAANAPADATAEVTAAAAPG